MEKIIVINNKNDLDKFYSRIKYYRSPLYRFTTFKSDNKEIDLNIKRRCKRIKFVYEESCDYIDNYNNKQSKNICGFVNNKCRNNVEFGCCRKCFYLGKKGCTTSNLTCKLFFCTKVCDKFKILTFDDVKRNQIIVKHNFYTRKEDYLVDLYIGWITITILRYFYRTIKHKFVKKNN